MSRFAPTDGGLVGLTRMPITPAVGTNSRSNSSRFSPSTLVKKVTPCARAIRDHVPMLPSLR
jgi:hypothetical protein